jgi:hypothetical protein
MGDFDLGGLVPAKNFALPAMSKTALPYIAHLYDHNLVFKRTLGGASIINKPGLKLTQNASYQPITLELATSLSDFSTNLIANPSFEPVHDPAVWAIVNAGPEAATFFDVTSGGHPAYDGANFVRVSWVVPNTSTKGLTAPMAWVPGKVYVVSFYARTVSAAGGAIGQQMALLWGVNPNLVVADSNPGLTGGWQRYVFRVLWGATADTALAISIASPCAAGGMDFDAVQVEEGVQPARSPRDSIELADVIRLTEAGDNAGTILFSGNVETTPEELAVGAGATHHLIVVVPWGAELGLGYFDHQYITPTIAAPADPLRDFTQGPIDVANFVRDAVDTTAHLSVTPLSCPDTGIVATYDFQDSNPLDAVHVAKQIAGANWWYFTDAEGIVWFQPITLDVATLTLRKGIDYDSVKPSATIDGMKNLIPINGGSVPGDPGRIKSLYTNTTSQARYGKRAFNPTLAYPQVTDQGTLDQIAASLGALYDREVNTMEVDLPALGLRLSPGRDGGLKVRFRDSAVEPLGGAGGSGGYSPVFILQDVECIGPGQKLIVGDIPYSDIDTAYEAMRVAQRISAIAATAVLTAPVAPPALPPPVPAVVTRVAAKAVVGAHLYAMGVGTFTICSANFTTLAAGTVQLNGALDCRMDAWDNYIAAPRRDVWCEIIGGALGATGKGTVTSLPWAITRLTADDGNIINTLALPAGAYTVRWRATTTEYNQLRVYSGYAQAVTTI